MKSVERKRRIEFGDFQTPPSLASQVCERLLASGICPETVIEPTCGTGAFVFAAAKTFRSVQAIYGFDVNEDYLSSTIDQLAENPSAAQIHIEYSDFFLADWQEKLSEFGGSILVLGNLPWVTNAAQGAIGGANLPQKSNFQNHRGFDAISGKSNFDISEWMLLEVFRWFKNRPGTIAMLVKTAVARKILSQAKQQRLSVRESFLVRIDAKRHFGASVDACLLVIKFGGDLTSASHDYTVFEDFEDSVGRRVGHRKGLTVGDLDVFTQHSFLLGNSPQKWRSGVKHDASSIMEFTNTDRGLENGMKEAVDIEHTFLFPLLKGSDIGSNKQWREKYVLVTQRAVGEPTAAIREIAPATWRYLERHAAILDSRGSTIYAKNPRFSIFGVGDYTFRPWRIAICGLYKTLRYRVVGPIAGKPVMFDDTVYYISFESEQDALEVFDKINTKAAMEFLSSLIFWDEKRPIKTSILNVLDWTKLAERSEESDDAQLELDVALPPVASRPALQSA